MYNVSNLPPFTCYTALKPARNTGKTVRTVMLVICAVLLIAANL